MSDANLDAGRLAGDALAGFVRAIEHTHLSISDRAFDAVGAVADPIRSTHHAVTRATYSTVAGAHAVAARLGAMFLGGPDQPTDADSGTTPAAAHSSPSPPVERLMSVVQGLRGDRVGQHYPALAFSMAVRDPVGDRDVELIPSELVAAHPGATAHIAVFVHGWCDTDRTWRPSADDVGGASNTADPSSPRESPLIGERLRRELGVTPVYVRYNTGLAVADNAAMLADLLQRLVDAWPVPVEHVDLIGHSMGGLVIRTACGVADAPGWIDLVGHAVCIATPHLGTPLARSVDRVLPVLERYAETRPLADFLRTRSDGVKDLSRGLDTAALDEQRSSPAHIQFHVIGATVSTDLRHPIGQLAGDLVVSYTSAAGALDADDPTHVGGVNHLGVLHHREVGERILGWLGGSRTGEVAAPV